MCSIMKRYQLQWFSNICLILCCLFMLIITVNSRLTQSIDTAIPNSVPILLLSALCCLLVVMCLVASFYPPCISEEEFRDLDRAAIKREYLFICFTFACVTLLITAVGVLATTTPNVTDSALYRIFTPPRININGTMYPSDFAESDSNLTAVLAFCSSSIFGYFILAICCLCQFFGKRPPVHARMYA